MNSLMFIIIITAVSLVLSVVFYFIGEKLAPFGFVLGILIGLVAFSVCKIAPLGETPNPVEKEWACSNQRIVTETATVLSLPENAESKYLCYSSLKQETVCEITKIKESSDGNIICYIKGTDGSMNPISVFDNNVQVLQNTDEESNPPRLVKTETYKTLVLVEKPKFFKNAIYSINYEGFEVGDVCQIEQNPSETTYTVILSEQDFQSLSQNTAE